MILVLVTLLVAFAPDPAHAQAAAAQSPSDEIVHIDGKKNPEMIPEWSAWEDGLSILAKGPRLIPEMLTPHLSSAETALLLQEAAAQVKRESVYHERVKRLALLAGKETKEEIRERNRNVTLEYRWQILYGRDRLLAALNPAAQAALTRWVELTKQGTTISILRKDLPFFLQPQ